MKSCFHHASQKLTQQRFEEKLNQFNNHENTRCSATRHSVLFFLINLANIGVSILWCPTAKEKTLTTAMMKMLTLKMLSTKLGQHTCKTILTRHQFWPGFLCMPFLRFVTICCLLHGWSHTCCTNNVACESFHAHKKGQKFQDKMTNQRLPQPSFLLRRLTTWWYRGLSCKT